MSFNNDFYQISIPLDYEDTVKLCISNKELSKRCDDRYWVIKAKTNYDYDLQFAYGKNNRDKYKWLEDNILSHEFHNKNTNSYFWNKYLQYHYELKNIIPPSYNMWDSSKVATYISRVYDGDANFAELLQLARDSKEFVQNYLVKYGTIGLRDKRELPKRIQNTASEIFNGKSKDQLIEFDMLLDWVQDERYDDVIIFLNEFNANDVSIRLSIMENIINPGDQDIDFTEEFLDFIAQLYDDATNIYERQQGISSKLFSHLLNQLSAPEPVISYLLNNVDIDQSDLKYAYDQVNNETNEESFTTLRNYLIENRLDSLMNM